MHSFVNRQIDDLPTVRDIRFSRVDGRYLAVSLLAASVSVAVLAGGAVGYIWMNPEVQPPQRYIVVALLTLWLLMMVYRVLAYRCLAYAIRQQDIAVSSGVVYRRLVVQPLSRLQHVEVSRGPLERLFGLATLRLFSAGGAAHSLAVPGLPLARAERLREFILDNRALDDE